MTNETPTTRIKRARRQLRFSLIGLFAFVTIICIGLAAARWQWPPAGIMAGVVLLVTISPLIAVVASLVPPGSPLLASKLDRIVVAFAATAVTGLVIWVIVQIAPAFY
jgi:hypothetical protein